MTIQQWLFSFKGRIGRRDFWIWIGLWIVGMLVLFSLASKQLLDIQTAAFCLVCLLWPTAAVTVKRLHDRALRSVGAVDDPGVDAAGRKLGDITRRLAMGGWSLCSDAHSGRHAHRSGRVHWHPGRK